MEMLDSDADFSKGMNELIPNIRHHLIRPRSWAREAPPGWTWHQIQVRSNWSRQCSTKQLGDCKTYSILVVLVECICGALNRRSQ